MTSTGIELKGLATGVLWQPVTLNTPSGSPVSAVTLPAPREQFVYLRNTTTQVSVYEDIGLTIPIPGGQPITSNSDGTIPGYIEPGLDIDFYDVLSGVRSQGNSLSEASAAVPADVVIDSSASPIGIDSTGVASGQGLLYNASTGKLQPAPGIVSGTQQATVRASGDTSGVADKANILAAIAALPAPAGGVVELTDPAYYLPAGAGIAWSDRRVTIRGRGRGSGTPGTTVFVAAGGTAFNPQNGASGYGSGSHVEAMRVQGSDTSSGTNDGILVQCNSGVVRDVDAEGFGQHGVHILSGAPGTPFVVDGAFNANNWACENVRAASNYGSGIKAEGIDSSAGFATNIDSENNHGEGLWDNGSFGSTWEAPQLAGNLSHAIRCGANSGCSRFLGVYKEGDSNPALLIESGNGGQNVVDFRVLVGNSGETVIDSSAAQDSVIVNPGGGYMKQNRLFIGDQANGVAWQITTPGATAYLYDDTTISRGAAGVVAIGGATWQGRATPAYASSVTLVTNAEFQTITATNGTAFAIYPPVTPPGSSQTAAITVEVLNSSGGALGTLTWNTAFVFPTGSWTNPANTKRRFARFQWNGSEWVCTSIASADY